MPNDLNLNNNALVCTHIGKTYATHTGAILEDVNLSITKGSFVSIIGQSGCGKSTLLKIFAGISQPTEGTFVCTGRVSMVFQNGALLPWYSCLENVVLALRAEGVSATQARTRATAELAALGLHDYLNRYPHELSGGQRQRVGIARALAVDPEILILDEPFSALDPKTTDELHTELLNIWEKTGKTIVLVSHSIEEALLLSQEVVLMKAGHIVHHVQIEMPRPRDIALPRFQEYMITLKKLF